MIKACFSASSNPGNSQSSLSASGNRGFRPAGRYQAGLVTVGADTDLPGEHRFAFDNEGPVNSVYLKPYALANRLVTNAEFQAFVDDGGYQRPEFWLADGWGIVQQQRWQRLRVDRARQRQQ
jgi:formylglycine-generating enzyme required for sulfatase activity